MKTRAALFRAAGVPLELREIEVAEPDAGQVLVRMAAVGVCGSDLHVIRGEWQRPAPMILGHEGSGIVEAVGPGVESPAVGDPVVISWAPSCGECAGCRLFTLFEQTVGIPEAPERGHESERELGVFRFDRPVDRGAKIRQLAF
jgi:Zn-dependent alcohol dehydrogenase